MSRRDAIELLTDRVVDLATRRPSQRLRTRLLGVAALLFIGVTIAALTSLPLSRLDLLWSWVAIAFVLSGFMALANASEYWLAARWLGISVEPVEALRVSVLASAANLTPLPGAILVRGYDLVSRGADSRSAGRSLAGIGVAWLSVSFMAAAISFWAAAQASFAVGSLVIGFTGAAILRRVVPAGVNSEGLVVGCLLVEVLVVGVQGARFLAVIRAIGLDATIAQVLALPLSGALASATGIFPGGLGLRELLAGVLSTLVTLPVATGILGTAADRIIGLLFLSSAALVLTRKYGVGSARSEGPADETNSRTDA